MTLIALHAQLGIATDYGNDPLLPRYAEAKELIEVGPNIVGRVQKLTRRAAALWSAMVASAAADAVELLLVSGYRSYEYQGGLIENKLNNGESIDQILTVNAAPGYSQHHTGEAVDLATPGCRPLSEEFEASDAFAWLQQNARRFRFYMPYPRDNPLGFIYEPWHWALTHQASDPSSIA